MTASTSRLVWDSEFFGFAIGKLESNRPMQSEVTNLIEWMHAESIDCSYVLVDTDSTSSVRSLEAVGARLVDLRVTLNRDLDESVAPVAGIGPATEADIDGLKQIARHSHSDSRFYADDGFPDDRCDDLYVAWIENSHRENLADVVLVARDEGGPTGYITCNRKRDGGSISLVAVAEHARGAGLGSRLIEASLAWFSAQRVSTVSVVTQGRNTGALRMYERAGFTTNSIQLWYHVWRGEVAGTE